MFFTLKEQSFSQREKRKMDRLQTQSMEEDFQKAREKMKQDEQNSSEVIAPRSRIITPGTRIQTGRREVGTPMRRRMHGI
jgi:hypothetical protein